MAFNEDYLDLAQAKLGGKVLFATDDFFAEKENLIQPGRGIFIPDKYTERGKWMDGWESRRKRVSGHDWAVLKLATPGCVHGFDIDTNHFLGNHPPHASVEALKTDKNLDALSQEEFDALPWNEILPKSPLDPGSQHLYACDNHEVYTHIRLHIYPDGGVARFRVYGEVAKDWQQIDSSEEIDLAAAINGAKAITCNDMFFSSKDNLIMPGKGVNMGDGWETKRNRTPGNRDWIIIRLAHPGKVDRVLVDTHHFKGNYPDCCSLEFCSAENDKDVLEGNVDWREALSKQKLSAHAEHVFEKELTDNEVVTHARLFIYPDGGVSRLRLFGKIVHI